MPVNDLTEVELQTYIEANPDVLNKVIAPVLTKKEYSLMSKDQKARYDSDQESQYVGAYVSKTAPLFESSIKDLTGLEKASSEEKYYDYGTRAVKTLKDERDALKLERDALVGKSDITKIERDQLEDLRNKVKEYDKKVKDLTEGSAKELSKAKLENKIVQKTNSVTPKLIKDDRPGFAKAMSILADQLTSEISNMAQVDQRGEIILVGADGKAITKDGLFVTVEQYFESGMSEAGFIDDGKQQPGAGGGGKDSVDIKNIPGGVKTQVELMAWLRDNTMKGKDQKALVAEFDKYAHLLPRQ